MGGVVGCRGCGGFLLAVPQTFSAFFGLGCHCFWKLGWFSPVSETLDGISDGDSFPLGLSWFL